MEDERFFYYANVFLNPHGFFLDVKKNTVIQRIWAFFNLFNMEVMLVMVTLNIYYKFPDVDLMVANSTAVFGFLVNTFKITALLVRVNDFARFHDKLKDLWNVVTQDEKQLLMQHKTFVNVVSMINFITLFLGLTWWLLLPPAFSAWEEYRFGSAIWTTPYNITYIDGMNRSPGYAISTVLFFIGTMFCIVGGCGFDSFFLESCFFLSAHFDIIRDRFKAVKFSLSPEDTTKIYSEVASVVKYHNLILDTCNELQELVKAAVFLFLLFDSILICTCFYTVIKIPDISKTLAFGGLSCATVAQIFVLTSSGDFLFSKSQSVCLGIYESNWYEGLPEQRKFLIPCMIKGRKGLVFKMGLFELSLTTLTLILQTAGSYLALLKSISSR